MRVLVCGDVMIDKYTRYTSRRISPEAPVPVAVEDSYSVMLGGAGNVAANLNRLGADVHLISLVGKDKNAELMRSLCDNYGIKHTLSEGLNSTITKERLVVNGQQVLRIDNDDINVKCELDIKGVNFSNFDVVVVSDYNKGSVTGDLVNKIYSMFTGPIICDPKGINWTKYENCTVVTPNESELRLIIGDWKDDRDLVVKARQMLLKYRISNLLLTRSEKGVALITTSSNYFWPADVKEVIDVSGAGDTVVAVLARFLNILGIDMSSQLANLGGSIVVSKYATAQLSLDELLAVVSSKPSFSIVLCKLINNARGQNTLVFSNGCFDMLHSGHIHLLKEARKYGDRLIIGLNSDDSVRRLKGEGRPLQTANIRKSALLATGIVDEVIVFDENTPLALITALQPDFLVKGGDYIKSDIIGADFVESYGGKVRIVTTLDGYSTTNFINSINDR